MRHSVRTVGAEFDEVAGDSCTCAADEVDGDAPSRLRTCTASRAVAVLVLHAQDCGHTAVRLAQAWAPAVPAASISVLPIGAEDAGDGVRDELARTGRDLDRLLLVGIGDAAAAVLRLVFHGQGLACAGVLVCGDVLPPLALLTERPAPFRTRLRLVWTSHHALFSADALAALLGWFRAGGIDAQGTVLDRAARSQGGDAEPEPALVRMGRAYLAELVAFALAGPKPA
jgi:hypothetical protein